MGGEPAAPMDGGPAIFLSAVSVTNKQTSLIRNLSSFLLLFLLSSCLLSVLTLNQHHPSLCISEIFLSAVIFSLPVYLLSVSPNTQNFLLAVENLALGKPATQSDVLWSYKPGLAVDGDPNTCSFTSREESPRWWQVGSLSS